MIRAILSWPHIFPACLLTIYVCSAIRYAVAGDYWRAMYWVSAGLINVSTLGMGKR